MMNEDKVQCALIGYGYWGKIVARYLEKSDFFELKYICDPYIVNAPRWEDVLANEAILAVFVCTPINTHYEIVKSALEQEKHVFCEKPLTENLDQATELVKLAKDKKVCLYTDYIYTVSPSINFIKSHLKSIGPILRIEGEIRQFGKFYDNDSVEEVLGVHLISATLHILGITQNIKVEKYKPLRLSGKNVVESEFELLIPEVRSTHFLCSLVSETKVRKIRFIGENGILLFDMLGEYTAKQFLINRKGNGYDVKEERLEIFDEKNNLSEAILTFYNNIQNESVGNYELAIAVAEIIEKLRNMAK